MARLASEPLLSVEAPGPPALSGSEAAMLVKQAKAAYYAQGVIAVRCTHKFVVTFLDPGFEAKVSEETMSQRRGRVMQVGMLFSILAGLGGFCQMGVSNLCAARPIQIRDDLFAAGWYRSTSFQPVVKCSDVGLPWRRTHRLHYGNGRYILTEEGSVSTHVFLHDRVHLTGTLRSVPDIAAKSDTIWAEVDEIERSNRSHATVRWHNLGELCIQAQSSSGATLQSTRRQSSSGARAGSEEPVECYDKVPLGLQWAFPHVAIVSPCIFAWTRKVLLMGGSFMRVMVQVVRAHTSGLHGTSLRGCGWVTPEGSYVLLLLLPVLTIGIQGAPVLALLNGWMNHRKASDLILLKNIIKGDFTLSILFSLVGAALVHGLATSTVLGVSKRLAVAMERKLSHQSQDRSNGLLGSLYFSHAASQHVAVCQSDLDGLWQCSGLQRAVQDDVFPFDVSDGSLSLLGSTRTFNELPAYMVSLFIADIDVEVVFTQKVESLRARLRRKWILCIALPFSASVVLTVWFWRIWQGAYPNWSYFAYGMYIAILGFTADAYCSKLPEKVTKLYQFGKEIPLEGNKKRKKTKSPRTV